MAMTINTNVVSINAQRNLGLSGNSLGTTMQRLSSGLRVNSAKDDAAGLAIAERMNAQSKGLAVAARNANDGISLAQTAEGALGKVGDMLQRMRELAVQSSNATNSTADREALQAEVNQLRSEIDRVAKTTTFNGQKILDGSFTGGVFQIGAGAGDNITVGGITNAKVSALSTATFGASTSSVVKADAVTDFGQAIEKDTLKLRVGTEVTELGEIAKANSGQERMGQVVAAINAKTADTGVTAFLSGDEQAGFKLEVRSTSGDAVSFEGFSTATTGFGGVTADVAKAALATGVGSITEAYEAAKAVLAPTTPLDKDALLGVDAATAGPFGAATGEYAVGSTSSALLATVTGKLTDEAKQTWEAALGEFVATYNSNVTVAVTTPTASPKAMTDGQAAAINAAMKTLGTELEKAVQMQGEQNIAGASADIYQKLDAVLALSDEALKTATAGANDAITKTGAIHELHTAMTAVGMSVSVDTLAADATAEEVQAVRNAILSAVDKQMTGGLGISTIDTDAKGNVEASQRTGIESLDISTQAGAWEALQQIDNAIDQINSARADLGALQTRFEKAIENIDIMNENISAARGRIVDADFAAETANLSRSQILQQAGTAMVAQANQLPQQVLSLLQ